VSPTFPSRRVSAAVIVTALLVAACGSSQQSTPAPESGGDGLLVVTTVSPITNLVANVVCDAGEVVGLVPEGVNSHTFAPAPSDAFILAEADIVFVNGLNLELPAMALAEANVRDGVEIFSLGEATIEPEDYIFDFSFPEEEGDPNPHLWTNPLYALDYAELIADKMSSIDPENADRYQANFDRLRERIELLDAAVREATATIPPERRQLLTYHDSFPYFAREYEWQVIGAIQPSDFSEPTAREVADLILQIRAEKVPAIFGSEVFSSPVLERIANETGARYVDELRDDDLPGGPGDPDHSYFGLMVFDFRTMVEALGGDASALEGFPTDNFCDRASYEQ
jgi:ABC-type Zn uptake system ZnuABC Zn-binding protein ZnuA